jgi:hypothetical protein
LGGRDERLVSGRQAPRRPVTSRSTAASAPCARTSWALEASSQEQLVVRPRRCGDAHALPVHVGDRAEREPAGTR